VLRKVLNEFQPQPLPGLAVILFTGLRKLNIAVEETLPASLLKDDEKLAIPAIPSEPRQALR